MERLKLFAILIKIVWAVADWFVSLKKPAPDPAWEDGGDQPKRGPDKPKVKVRTAKRTPPKRTFNPDTGKFE
jgi:hypothetical protein